MKYSLLAAYIRESNYYILHHRLIVDYCLYHHYIIHKFLNFVLYTIKSKPLIKTVRLKYARKIQNYF